MRGIVVRPEQEGLRAFLFDLEADIMEVVWEREWASFSVAQVHRVLHESRAIAYKTVMTTVDRFFHK